jgi:tetratricopeptide (TPR) repeat protein
MTIRTLTPVLLLASVLSFGQHSQSPAKAPLLQGMGNHHHAVSTKNAEAQQFFDQGVSLIYGFNHDEAERSFRRAAELDPNLAMAWWGVALAVGPNYNLPVDAAREKIAFEAIQKAQALSATATPSERTYIQALSKRYTSTQNPNYQQLAVAYKDAMRDLSKRFPDDLDAATLYAESMMNLRPWGLWSKDGSPSEGTPEILSVLESVLKRDPKHMGAVHYYIHAVEASPHPERGLAAANRLASMAPAAGHLVHMPAHIYIRTGDYESAVQTNQDAAKADEEYIRRTGAQGIYPMMYYSHNLHFIAAAAGMEGRYGEAKQAADRLATHVRPMLKDAPMLEAFMTMPMAVELRFERWDDVLQIPQPPADQKITSAIWHYARGMALAATGKPDQAEAEHKILIAVENATPADAIFAPPFNNKTTNILRIANNVLAAKIAAAKRDPATAVAQLRNAVTVQDSLNYGEPPDWYFPVREALGNVLLANGRAAEAEQVFREDLERNPRNGRSLFGLSESLKAEGKTYDAQLVRKQFEAAWSNAEMPLSAAR